MGKGKCVKEVKSNITDDQSAKMTTSKGTIQAFQKVEKKKQEAGL